MKIKQASESRKATVTDEHKAEAGRLAAIWAEKKPSSQAQFGEDFGIGNQSAVSQFLLAKTPLSLEAARGFATGLGCQISDFSPRLAAEAASMGSVAGSRELDLTRLSRPELNLVQMFRALPPEGKRAALLHLEESLTTLVSKEQGTERKELATSAVVTTGARNSDGRHTGEGSILVRPRVKLNIGRKANASRPAARPPKSGNRGGN